MNFMNKIMKNLRPSADKGKCPPEDRRRYPRVSTDLPLEYWTQENSHVRSGGIVLDASDIGFRIHSIQNMGIGTQLKITVFYICEYKLETLEVFAEIVWENANKNRKYLYGMKIIEMMEKDRSKLIGILKQNSIRALFDEANKNKSGKERSRMHR
jgi:hypothetical protein